MIFRLLSLLKDNIIYDTKYLSSIETNNIWVRSLINLGHLYPQLVIDWLIAQLQQDDQGAWYWCYALGEIVTESIRPTISEENAGRIDDIINIWLAWDQSYN